MSSRQGGRLVLAPITHRVCVSVLLPSADSKPHKLPGNHSENARRNFEVDRVIAR